MSTKLETVENGGNDICSEKSEDAKLEHVKPEHVKGEDGKGEDAEESKQIAAPSSKAQCLNECLIGKNNEEADSSLEAERGVTHEPVDLPFDLFLAGGPLPSRPRSFIEETYEIRYIVDSPSLGDDMWAYFHPNNVVILGLTALHRALKSSTAHVSTDAGKASCGSLEVKYAQVGGKDLVDVRDNGGKMQKKTGVWVKSDSTVCTIKVLGTDNDPAVCKAGIKGKFLAANKALCQDPSILFKRPHDEGFLCILCLYADDRRSALQHMLTREQYCELRGVHEDKLR